MHHPPEIPCYIIAGPLGVGKTSAVLHHLRTHASQQRVGVLVNDFGPVGLDGATLRSEAPETRVLNVSGGCICCTLLSELPKKIQQLLSEQALDRLIIEPSGMATPTQVIGLAIAVTLLWFGAALHDPSSPDPSPQRRRLAFSTNTASARITRDLVKRPRTA